LNIEPKIDIDSVTGPLTTMYTNETTKRISKHVYSRIRIAYRRQIEVNWFFKYEEVILPEIYTIRDNRKVYFKGDGLVPFDPRREIVYINREELIDTAVAFLKAEAVSNLSLVNKQISLF